MMYLMNLLAPTTSDSLYYVYLIVSVILIVLMLVAAVAAIIMVLMQPANSDGINALSGSSDTFFGKNKGKSIEAKLKKATGICLTVLGVLAVVFYVLQYEGFWS